MALLSLSLLPLLLLAQSNPGRASTNATATYPIVDTGQTNCYDDTGSAISCPAGGNPSPAKTPNTTATNPATPTTATAPSPTTTPASCGFRPSAAK